MSTASRGCRHPASTRHRCRSPTPSWAPRRRTLERPSPVVALYLHVDSQLCYLLSVQQVCAVTVCRPRHHMRPIRRTPSRRGLVGATPPRPRRQRDVRSSERVRPAAHHAWSLGPWTTKGAVPLPGRPFPCRRAGVQAHTIVRPVIELKAGKAFRDGSTMRSARQCKLAATGQCQMTGNNMGVIRGDKAQRSRDPGNHL